MIRPMPDSIDHCVPVLPSRFAWLMGLYGENYHRLIHLFAPQRLAAGSYVSSVDDHLDVQLDVIQHHRYTLDLRLTYRFLDDVTGHLSPLAHLRMYCDAHLAEVVHFHVDHRLPPGIGPIPLARTAFQRRVRMNSFLNRWLEYLAEQGHSIGTLQRCADAAPIPAHVSV